MSGDLTLTIVDGVRVVVPDRLDHATPYVLREQGDWFEHEIRFLRRALQPGGKAVDIGANYGLYTLSMARTVGPLGHVWAYEPASRTHAFLVRSVQANQFSQVTAERSALSDRPGTGHLTSLEQPELNSLREGGGADTEQVPLVTLDERMHSLGWPDIDFLKLDAEGVEEAILAGGRRFLTEMCPMVQVELGDANTPNLRTLDTLAGMGYRPYRVVPGLGVLVPLDPAIGPDPFLLNAMCCRPERAQALADRGLLFEHPLPAAAYGGDAATLYRGSRETTRPMRERLALLLGAFTAAQRLAPMQPGHMSSTTLACAARDLGERVAAIGQLGMLATALLEGEPPGLAEAFTLPCERYARVPAGTRRREWAFACVNEEFERLYAWSSFYDPESSAARLQLLEQLGFLGPEMATRLDLIRRRQAERPA